MTILSLGQGNVKDYRAECAPRERASLELKGKEIFAHRVHMENEQDKLDQDHESLLLESHAWHDVQDYAKELMLKSLSLAIRAKDKPKHFD